MKDTMCGLVKEVNAPSGLVYHTDLSIPEINDDEVLIKVHCSAICGTDLHIMEWDEWSQKRIKAPVTVGHETAGEIVAVGKNVTERKVGDRVSCESHIPCGECYFCKNGMPHICKNVKLFGCTQNGAFAEYAKIRWDCTFLLEDDVTDEAACMFEPMGAGIHGVEAAEVNGKTVLVSGCGPIGLTAISASKTFGAVKVIACDLIDEKLEVAKKMGADAVLNSALKCLRAAGRLVCVGLPTKSITFHDMTDDLVYREVQLTGVSGRKIWETWEDFAKVMKGPYFKLDQVIGGRFPMKDFEAALAQIHSGVPGKMILYP